MFALIDGNDFCANCQQVFETNLLGNPLVVLSNKDGCAIARSTEAKALGVKMGHPAHEPKEQVSPAPPADAFGQLHAVR